MRLGSTAGPRPICRWPADGCGLHAKALQALWYPDVNLTMGQAWFTGPAKRKILCFRHTGFVFG